eukprot:4929787-Lingulodinium_polyedra.AAC.1
MEHVVVVESPVGSTGACNGLHRSAHRWSPVASTGPTTTEHPVVHSGLNWCLHWAILVSAVHNDPEWCLQCAI